MGRISLHTGVVWGGAPELH